MITFCHIELSRTILRKKQLQIRNRCFFTIKPPDCKSPSTRNSVITRSHICLANPIHVPNSNSSSRYLIKSSYKNYTLVSNTDHFPIKIIHWLAIQLNKTNLFLIAVFDHLEPSITTSSSKMSRMKTLGWIQGIVLYHELGAWVGDCHQCQLKL